jgi:ElaB/YqjD/DUF883 family membrane-anchored ribosome-binding protein
LSQQEIRQQIALTRASLTQKLESLERQVKVTIDTSAESFKEKVDQVAQSIKQTFDLRQQLEQHPWLTVGGSFVVGYLAGSLLLRERGARLIPGRSAKADVPGALNMMPSSAAMEPSVTDQPAPAAHDQRAESKASAPTFLEQLTEELAPELRDLKALAIRVTAELLREVIQQTLQSARSAQAATAPEDARSTYKPAELRPR